MNLNQYPIASRARPLLHRKRHKLSCWLISVMLLVLCCTTAVASLNDLLPIQQQAIQRICAPLQFEQGASAHRACVLQQSKQLNHSLDSTQIALRSLSSDERFAVQSVCSPAGTSLLSDEYSQCADKQLAALESVPQSTLFELNDDESNLIRQQCAQTQTSEGVRAYRVCVNSAIDSLATLPAATFGDIDPTQRRSIRLECAIHSSTVDVYRVCLLRTLGIDFEQTGTPVEPTGVSDNQVALKATNAADVIVATERLGITTSSEDPEISATDQQSETALSANAQDTHKNSAVKVLLSVLALAALGIIGMAAWKNRKRNDPEPDLASAARDSRQQLKQRVVTTIPSSPNTTTPSSPNVEPLKANSNLLDESFQAILDDEMPEPMELDFDPLDETYFEPLDIEGHPDEHHDRVQHTTVKQQPTDASPDDKLPADRMPFLLWLEDFTPQARTENAIELLNCWTAFANNQVDPTMRKAVFTATQPDTSTLIKRWALKKDIHALEGAITFIQNTATLEQRIQIINLLMALHVYERALTPAHNNLLRFLTDAFGLGHVAFNRHFKILYGHPLPPVPRPDKLAWWEAVPEEQFTRWNALGANQPSDDIHHRIVLGQALHGPLDTMVVKESYKRAMLRCSERQASALGLRERSLLTSQRQTFRLAYQALEGVIT